MAVFRQTFYLVCNLIVSISHLTWGSDDKNSNNISLLLENKCSYTDAAESIKIKSNLFPCKSNPQNHIEIAKNDAKFSDNTSNGDISHYYSPFEREKQSLVEENQISHAIKSKKVGECSICTEESLLKENENTYSTPSRDDIFSRRNVPHRSLFEFQSHIPKPYSEPRNAISNTKSLESSHGPSRTVKDISMMRQISRSTSIFKSEMSGKTHQKKFSFTGTATKPYLPAYENASEDNYDSTEIWQNSSLYFSSFRFNVTFLDSNATECPNSSFCNTSTEHAPTFRPHTLMKGLILLGLGLVALFGNVATLVSIVRRGRQNSSTVYLLLIHLSVADLMVTWFCIIGESMWTLSVQWYAGNLLCKLFKFLQMLGLYLSTFTLVVIGFDRLCAVRFPMRRVKARMQVHKSILIAWILSCTLSVPQALIFRVVKGPFIEEFYQCVTYGFYTAPWQEQLYTSVSLFCMFLIPLFILVGTYATTFATIANSGKLELSGKSICKNRVFGGTQNPFEDARRKILRKAKVKSLWITVVIVSTFIICWTPYYISMIISVFLEPDEQLGQDLSDAIFFFGSSTAVLNPVIYGAFHLRRNERRPSKGSSSRFEASVALSTLRKIRSANGRIANNSSQLNGKKVNVSNIEVF